MADNRTPDLSEIYKKADDIARGELATMVPVAGGISPSSEDRGTGAVLFLRALDKLKGGPQ